MKIRQLGIACAALAGALLVFNAGNLRAQGVQRSVSFGVQAGPTLALGDFGDSFDAGYHFGALLGFRSPTSPVGFRLDGTWHNNDAKGANFHMRTILVTANIEYEFPTQSTVAPYLIGGVGLGNVKLIDDDGDNDGEAESKFAWNAGGGIKLKLAGFNMFAETRFNSIMTEDTNLNMLPITVGIVF